MNSIDVYTAWSNAEHECVKRLFKLVDDELKFNPGTTAIIGDRVDLTGKINVFCFSIAGGDAQEHQYQSGAANWHTTATLKGLYDSREKAMMLATLMMRAVPFNDIPGVTRLYLLTHPRLETIEMRVANTEEIQWAYYVEVTFGIVYGIV